jgi:hypothetical protein
LESALRAAKSLGVDIILRTEAKLTQGIYARNSAGTRSSPSMRHCRTRGEWPSA